METQTVEPVIITKDSGNKYDRPDVRKYIQVKKADGWNWAEIADGLKERGYDKISGAICSNIYTKMTAKAVVHSTEGKELMEDLTDEVKKSYQDAIQILGQLVKNLRVAVEEANPEDVDNKMEILKVIPYATNLMKSIRENMALQLSLQDTIIKEGEKQLYSTPAETMETINKYSGEIIKENAKLIAQRIVKRYDLPKDEIKNIVRDIEKEINFN